MGKLIRRIDISKANDFLRFFSSWGDGPLWQNDNEEEWVFRGQENADWKLLASAFRVDPATGQSTLAPYLPLYRQLAIIDPHAQMDAEGQVLELWIKGARVKGIRIPGDLD